MNTYELTVVYSPKLDEKKRKQATKDLEALVKKCKGKVGKKDDWGMKQLAYPISKQTEGYYLHWLVDLPAEGPAELVKAFNVDEMVLRHLLIRNNEKEVMSNEKKRKKK